MRFLTSYCCSPEVNFNLEIHIVNKRVLAKRKLLFNFKLIILLKYEDIIITSFHESSKTQFCMSDELR